MHFGVQHIISEWSLLLWSIARFMYNISTFFFANINHLILDLSRVKTYERWNYRFFLFFRDAFKARKVIFIFSFVNGEWQAMSEYSINPNLYLIKISSEIYIIPTPMYDWSYPFHFGQKVIYQVSSPTKFAHK